jgi:hypothetical protein
MAAIEITSGLLGAAVVGMFFKAVATRWPLSYFSASDIVSQRVSAASLRYLLFRLGPVVVVSFFVGVTVSRLNAGLEELSRFWSPHTSHYRVAVPLSRWLLDDVDLHAPGLSSSIC